MRTLLLLLLVLPIIATAQKFDTICLQNNVALIGKIYSQTVDHIYLYTISKKDMKIPKDIIVKCTNVQLDSLRAGYTLTPIVKKFTLDTTTLTTRINYKQNIYLVSAGGYLAGSVAGAVLGSVLMGVGIASRSQEATYVGAIVSGASFMLNIGTAVNLIKAGKQYKYEPFVP